MIGTTIGHYLITARLGQDGVDWDPVANRRVLDLRTVRADMQGRFQIYGLAPGMWRVLSTLDLESPDPFEIDSLSPKTLKVEVGREPPTRSRPERAPVARAVLNQTHT